MSSLKIKIKMIGWVGWVAYMGVMSDAYVGGIL
jgi:hypothetical protein